MSDEIPYRVTSEPDMLRLLHDKDRHGMGSRELGEYACSIGLTPPGHSDRGWIPSIVFEYPAEAAQPIPVWDFEPREDHGEEDGWENDENPWDGVITVTDAPNDGPT